MHEIRTGIMRRALLTRMQWVYVVPLPHAPGSWHLLTTVLQSLGWGWETVVFSRAVLKGFCVKREREEEKAWEPGTSC
jgi:hypothetical protein